MRNSIVAVVGALVLTACTHTSAGKWEDKMIQGPGTRPEDSKVYLVRDGKRHWVTHGTWLVAHGYRWPQDVLHVSAEEINSIPLADMINDPT